MEKNGIVPSIAESKMCIFYSQYIREDILLFPLSFVLLLKGQSHKIFDVGFFPTQLLLILLVMS